MSKFSELYNGEWLDFKFKKQSDNCYAFFLGPHCLGQIFHMKRDWSCVSNLPHELSPFQGLKTRMDAAELLIKIWRQLRDEHKTTEQVVKEACAEPQLLNGLITLFKSETLRSVSRGAVEKAILDVAASHDAVMTVLKWRKLEIERK